MNKELIYRQNIQRSLHELYEHMTDNLLGWLPENADFNPDDITRAQAETIRAVEAIEAEWILDEDDRKENSLIQWTDEDD